MHAFPAHVRPTQITCDPYNLVMSVIATDPPGRRLSARGLQQEYNMPMRHLNAAAAALAAAILTASTGGAFAAASLDAAVDIMSGPGDNFQVIGKLKAGDNVRVSEKSS